LADKLKVKYSQKNNIDKIEMSVLLKIFDSGWPITDITTQKEILKNAGLPYTKES
jgi:uncharacterized protein YaaW (UPF0174 family)